MLNFRMHCTGYRLICNLYWKLLCKSFVLTCFLVQCLLHVTREIVFFSNILVAGGDNAHWQLFTQLERIFSLSNPRKILVKSLLQFWYIIIYMLNTSSHHLNMDIDVNKLCIHGEPIITSSINCVYMVNLWYHHLINKY